MKDEGRAETPCITLPAEPSSVSAARRFVHHQLAGRAIGAGLANDAVLVASELVTNAVLHAQGPIMVEVAFSADARSSVRVVVSDSSAVAPAMRDYGDGAATGRGLALIAALARRWGVEAVGSGKAVWVELDTSSADGTVTRPESRLRPAMTSADAGRAVCFLGVPVAGYLCLQEQNDAILRELELLSLSDDDGRLGPSFELADIVERARPFFRTNREGMRRDVVAAAALGRKEIDLEHVATVANLAQAEELVTLLEQAERLGSSGVMLLGPPDREVAHLRRWFVVELRRQVVDGHRPMPYAPLEP